MKRIGRTHLLVGAAALLLYTPGFWWGVPHATHPDRAHSWGVDAPMPLGPLAELHNILQPKPDRNLGYPLMHSFVVAGAYTPYLGYLLLTGGLSRPTPSYPYGFADPVGSLGALTLIANFLSVLMAAGVAVAAYDAGRVLWDRRSGLLAAAFVMLSYPMFYYSRTGNVDMLALMFTVLALNVFARILAMGLTVSRAAWLGTLIGLALATKEPSFASFLALPFVIAFRERRRLRELRRPAVWAAVAAFVAFGAGSGLFVDPGRFVAHLRFIAERSSAVAAGEVVFLQTAPFTWAGHLEVLRLIGNSLSDAMTLPGLALAAAGVAWCLWHEKSKAAFAWPALTYLAVLFLTVRTAQLRYVMPAVFTLAFFEARLLVSAWASCRLWLRSVCAVGFLAGTIGLLRGVDLTYAMINDSRFHAGRWLTAQTHPGDRVETFGPIPGLPPLKSEVESAQAIPFQGSLKRPRLDHTAVEEIIQGWKARRPHFIIVMPDYTSPKGAPFSGSCPPEIYRRLDDGSLNYRLSARFETPALIPWVRRPSLDYPTVNPPIRIFAAAPEVSARCN